MGSADEAEEESKDKSQVNDFKASDDEGDKEEIESENRDHVFLNATVTEEKDVSF